MWFRSAILITFLLFAPLLRAEDAPIHFTRVRLINADVIAPAERQVIERRLLQRLRVQTAAVTDAYSLEQAVHESTERAADEFRQRGYFRAAVEHSIVERSVKGARHIQVDLRVHSGALHRLAKISFQTSNILGQQEMRRAFPIRDGEIFNSAKIRNGLEDLRSQYVENGYINMMAVPEVTINDINHMVSMMIALHEDKQYRIGRVFLFGFKPHDETAIRRILKPGLPFAPSLSRKVFARYPVLRDENTLIRFNKEDGTVDLHFELPGYESHRFTLPNPVL
jgi:hypothetical protein